jgi:tetratricopeptide (TPR) repeat protein
MNQPFSPEPHSFLESSAPHGWPELSATTLLSAEHFIQMGNRHYHSFLLRGQKIDLERAANHFKEALAMHPAMAEAHVKLASVLWELESISLELAIDYCDTGIRLNPAYREGYLYKGYFLCRADRHDEAVLEFQRAITAVGPASGAAKAHLALGRVRIQQANAAGELSATQRMALTLSGLQQFAWGCCLLPLDQSVRKTLKNALFTDMQVFSLIGGARLMKAVGLRFGARAIYRWANHHLPEEAIFSHLLGDLYMETDDIEPAIQSYNQAKSLEPGNALLLKKLGQAYYRNQDADNAVKNLEQVVDTTQSDFDTLYALGRIHSDQSEYLRSLYYFKELLAQDTENPYLHSNVAYLLFKMEDYDGAVVAYQDAIRYGKDPIWTATVAQTLGTIYYQIQQDLEAAARVFGLAYQLDPTDLECLSMLGDIYTEQGNFETAIEVYQHILRFDPRNAECYNYMGYLLWQMDKNDDAIEAYRTAIELSGDNPIAYNNLGVIYLDEKCRPDSAQTMFEQALVCKPDYTLARFNVGRTLEALGKTADAAKSYSMAMRLNEINQELDMEEIKERLDNLFQV